MAWIVYILSLCYLADLLLHRGYNKLALLCLTPAFLVGLALMGIGVLAFAESVQEAILLAYQQPLYFPINLIVALLRGLTCGSFRINMLQ